ncbi:ATP-binding protein [Domibacillus robiginosus]|uniref:ATP-binding protein n=1 Tax=Domibacillus robiginosus TaxID=1071054 RepID=UPI00067B27EF|nr:ATP-binding protein [Domibacillus robiginosus]
MSTLFDNIQTFLLNVFLLYFCYSVYFKFIEKKSNKLTNVAMIALISGIAIILCMTFPVMLPNGYTADFRQFPLILGALYGGRRVAVFLLFVLLSYRFYLDIPSFEQAFFIYSLFIFLLCYIIPRFNKTINIQKKVLLAVLAFLLGTIARLTMLFLFLPEYINLYYFGLFISSAILQSLGVMLFVFFIERARKEAVLAKEISKLEKLKTVSTLAASISHEVRNPLTVTKGFLQLLDDSDLRDQDKKHYISTALEAIEKAESIITDYLTFAKPSLENTKILNLHQELIHIKGFVESYAVMNNVEIEMSLEENIYIASEKEKLHQCLINIIKNGIEAMPQGGKLTIELKYFKSNATINITDTGVGMNEEQLERLGSPFFTTKDLGTGLGSMVVYSIVKAMGGEIYVDSAPGKGTSFTVILSTAEEAEIN